MKRKIKKIYKNLLDEIPFIGITMLTGTTGGILYSFFKKEWTRWRILGAFGITYAFNAATGIFEDRIYGRENLEQSYSVSTQESEFQDSKIELRNRRYESAVSTKFNGRTLVNLLIFPPHLNFHNDTLTRHSARITLEDEVGIKLDEVGIENHETIGISCRYFYGLDPSADIRGEDIPSEIVSHNNGQRNPKTLYGPNQSATFHPRPSKTIMEMISPRNNIEVRVQQYCESRYPKLVELLASGNYILEEH